MEVLKNSVAERDSNMKRNRIQVYLLAVEELCSCEESVSWDRLTIWQQEKISRCRQTKARLLCLGGQLLLQYAAHAAGADFCGEADVSDRRCAETQVTETATPWQFLTGEQLLRGIPVPFPLEVTYGPQGKPHITNMPWHYNISHSGDYVVLAISNEPVGIDIQHKVPYNKNLIRRFFTVEEAEAYESLISHEVQSVEAAKQAMDLFYTLWCRKEAYGKLKGTGLTEHVLKRNMLRDTELCFWEYQELPDYSICVCGENE